MRLLAAILGLVLGISIPGTSRAQGTYYGMFYDTVLESYFLGTVDTASGSVSIYGNGIPAKWVTFGGNHMAADPGPGVAYVSAGPNVGPSSNRTLYTVDLATGNQLDSNPLQDTSSPVADLRLSPFLFDLDPSTGTIYGVVQTDVTPVENRTWWVATLDPATGEIDPIGAGFSLNSAGGASAIDPANGLFHFIGPAVSGGNRKIYSVSLTTGAVVANPDLDDGGVTGLLNAPDFLEFDEGSGTLFGVFGSNATNPRTRYLMQVNTTTGALTPVGDTFVETSGATGRGAIDSGSGIFFTMYRASSSVPFDLYSLDLDAVSGTVLSSPELDHGDTDKREFPDFVAFVPEPGAGVAAAAALGAVTLLRRRGAGAQGSGRRSGLRP